jgi:glycosyltransferase involved in cell wall biosynthesis
MSELSKPKNKRWCDSNAPDSTEARREENRPVPAPRLHPDSNRLTVFTMTYNYGRFLSENIDGVAAQTLPPGVFIVRDDCSPNDTLEDLEKILALYPWAKLHRNAENLGPVKHFQACVAQADTEYYHLHSADDFLVDPDFYKDAVRILDENPDIVMAFGYASSILDDGSVITPHMPLRDRKWTRLDGEALRDQLAFENPVAAVCVVMRNSVHERLTPWEMDNPHVHDWLYWYLMSYCGDFARIERVVVHKHLHGENVSEIFERSGIAGKHLDDGYSELLARQELSKAEKQKLHIGRRRHRIRMATALAFPFVCLRECLGRGALGAILESLLERFARKSEKYRKKIRGKYLKKYSARSW